MIILLHELSQFLVSDPNMLVAVMGVLITCMTLLWVNEYYL